MKERSNKVPDRTLVRQEQPDGSFALIPYDKLSKNEKAKYRRRVGMAGSVASLADARNKRDQRTLSTEAVSPSKPSNESVVTVSGEQNRTLDGRYAKGPYKNDKQSKAINKEKIPKVPTEGVIEDEKTKRQRSLFSRWFNSASFIAIAIGIGNMVLKLDERQDLMDEARSKLSVTKVAAKVEENKEEDEGTVTYKLSLPDDSSVDGGGPSLALKNEEQVEHIEATRTATQGSLVVSKENDKVDMVTHRLNLTGSKEGVIEETRRAPLIDKSEGEIEEEVEEEESLSEVFKSYYDTWFSEKSEDSNKGIIEVETQTAAEAEDHDNEVSVNQQWLTDYRFESEGDQTMITQLLTNGNVANLERALGAVYEEHYKYLTEDPKGQADLKTSVNNLSEIDLSAFLKPYQEAGIPEEIAFLIAIQESRGKVDAVSHSGARGINQIMPATARLFGSNKEDVFDPEEAAKVTTKYLKSEAKVFNRSNLPALVSIYNSGRGLAGDYLRQSEKEERDAHSFYQFLEKELNEETEPIHKHGYYKHQVQKGQSLNRIAKRYHTSVEAIVEQNPGLNPNRLSVGQEVKVPMNMATAIATVSKLRKLVEMLEYGPEFFAKWEALIKLGLLHELLELCGIEREPSRPTITT